MDFQMTLPILLIYIKIYLLQIKQMFYVLMGIGVIHQIYVYVIKAGIRLKIQSTLKANLSYATQQKMHIEHNMMEIIQLRIPLRFLLQILTSYL